MRTPERPRCSYISASLDEDIIGTASTVRAWILLELPGPWGYDALVDNRMPPELSLALRAKARGAHARLVLLRRPGRQEVGEETCYLAHTGARRSWLERLHLESPEDLLDVDLARFGEGEPTGAGWIDGRPLFLVCTNGRRDPCCAERGREVAAKLAEAFGERVWECTHIGGDRFAGNVVCFPDGIYFGRVTPGAAPDIAGGYEEGLIDLDHYRGRSAYGFATQAADTFLRRRHRLRGVNDLKLVSSRSGPDERVRVAFERPSGERLEIAVRVSRAPAGRRLTCHSLDESHPQEYAAVDGS